MEAWIAEELADGEYPDERLKSRLGRLLESDERRVREARRRGSDAEGRGRV